MVEMALEVEAQPYGQWSGCHAIAWDAAAQGSGVLDLTNLLSKQSYPLRIVVNREGHCFIDEGADFRNYTYAKYGAEILHQPNAIAYQLFDSKTEPLLRQDEYTAPGVWRFEANTLSALAERMGVDTGAQVKTVEEFNAAVQPGRFAPSIKDGKCTESIEPPKSNWAVPLDSSPFYGSTVTCGITFTFCGLRIDEDARVLDRWTCRTIRSQACTRRTIRSQACTRRASRSLAHSTLTIQEAAVEKAGCQEREGETLYDD